MLSGFDGKAGVEPAIDAGGHYLDVFVAHGLGAFRRLGRFQAHGVGAVED